MRPAAAAGGAPRSTSIITISSSSSSSASSWTLYCLPSSGCRGSASGSILAPAVADCCRRCAPHRGSQRLTIPATRSIFAACVRYSSAAAGAGRALPEAWRRVTMSRASQAGAPAAAAAAAGSGGAGHASSPLQHQHQDQRHEQQHHQQQLGGEGEAPRYHTRCLAIDAERLASGSRCSTSAAAGAAPPSAQAAAAPDGATEADATALAEAVALLRAGEVVALPTETVYGLGANALNADAVARIFAAKRRPQDNPLIVHVSSLAMLASLYPPPAPGPAVSNGGGGADAGAAGQQQEQQAPRAPGGWQLPAAYAAAVAAFWPGPLTILLPRSPLVPDCVTAGHATMAVRLPSHPVARALIEAAGFPLAAPSANSSGRPSPTLARHVMEDLDGRIPLVLDGGPCDSGVESTVLDALRRPPVVLRPGGVTAEALAALPGLAGLGVYARGADPGLEDAPTTPGMKYRHYSPAARVVLLEPVLPLEPPGGPAGGGGDGDDDDGHGAVRAALAGALAAEVAGLTEAGPEGLAPAAVGVLRTSLRGAPPGLCAAPPAGAGAGAALAGVVQYVLGDLASPSGVARELFKGLRAMDELGVQVIVVEGVADAAEGVAVMNRLRKAAARTVAVPVPAARR